MRYHEVGSLIALSAMLVTTLEAQLPTRPARTGATPVITESPAQGQPILKMARLDDATPPADVRTTPTSSGVTLIWPAVPGASSYTIARAPAAEGPYGAVTPTAIADTQFTDAGLPAATSYWYRVTATRADGHFGTSEPIAVTTAAVASKKSPVDKAAWHQEARPSPSQYLPAPAAVTPVNPTGFIAKLKGDGQVQLSWQPIEGSSYYVLRGPGIPNGEARVSGSTTYTATGVPAGTQEWTVGTFYEPGAVSTAAAEFPRARLTLEPVHLTGWVDLHTHPMINLAFAGKLVHGGVDVGSLLPQDSTCGGPTRAKSIEHALGTDRPSHGGHNFISFPCGDELRKAIIQGFQQGNNALVTNHVGQGRGAREFLDWPKWNDITHQKMWVDWIRRARDGGLRVMVALATNNRTLADAVAGKGDGPSDDAASGDLQIQETKAFVARHSDFMEIALGPGDVKRIVQANKIAVVLGVELDNIVNWNSYAQGTAQSPTSLGLVLSRIQHLHQLGVRYVLPVHVIDNWFGGTAVYQSSFNTANLREAGYFWELECADIGDDITFTYNEVVDPVRALAGWVKLGLDPARRSGPGPTCPPAGQGTKSRGHRNVRGLTGFGVIAIKQMMQRGMIVDIDHMSHHAAEQTLGIAEEFGYPVVSGHNGIRGLAGAGSENNRSKRQLERISKLHGMFGLGTDGVHKSAWATLYQRAMNIMGYPDGDASKAVYRNGAVAFGTDLNGLVKGPEPGGGNRVQYGPNFPKSVSGSKTWDYNSDGVAHYGMMADFVMDVRTAPASGGTSSQGVPLGVSGGELVDDHLNRGANYFWRMWELIDARKSSVR